METRNLAKELRIGNLIQYNKGGECKVIGIHEFGVDVEFPEEVTYIEYDQLSPIKLTEELLLKFGFEDVTGVDYILHIDVDFKLILIPADAFYPQIDQADDVGWNSISLNKIKYAHQLQNLYFTLTGEELEINLTTQ